MAHGDDTRDLARRDGFLTFLDSSIEAEYRDWRARRAAPGLRATTIGTAAMWAAMWFTMEVVGLPAAPRLRWVASWMMGAMLLSLLALARGSTRAVRLVTVNGQLTGAIAGAIALEAVSRGDHGAFFLEGAVVGCLLIVGSARLGLAVPAFAASLMMTAAQVYRAGAWRGGDVDGVTFALESVLLWSGLGSGVALAYVIERDGRVAFAQERIIDRQRQTIASQQRVLEKELSYQVAERSRELGAVLAKSDVTLDVRRLTAGERFAERYRIVSALGAGGMGAVYEVERVTDGSKLALKVVVGEVSGASAARFAREAEIGARVRHVNLISIVDVGVSSGVPFLVMELVRGGSLESQRAKFGDVAWALPILKQIAEGLAALHEAGVVHRDLKPANVLLADGGVAKISDFGISRFGALDEGSSIDASADTMAASPKPRSSELTGTGVVMGTPLYMAPEGARSARALDSSADVFAFGIIAYEMLTGRSPFPVPAFMLALAEQPIPVPVPLDGARVPRSFSSLVSSALAAEPSGRPRARALADVLVV